MDWQDAMWIGILIPWYFVAKYLIFFGVAALLAKSLTKGGKPGGRKR